MMRPDILYLRSHDTGRYIQPYGYPAGQPVHQPVLANTRQRLSRWIEETGDPLLEESVPVPDGILLHDPDELSPSEPPARHSGSKFTA